MKLRQYTFILHRYIGLFVGLILIVVGLTGSLLVFEHEIDDWMIQQHFGQVIIQEQHLSTEMLVNSVKVAYVNHPDWKIGQLQMLSGQKFYTVRLNRPDKTQWEVFVNPYNGIIIGDRQRETTIFTQVLNLHYQLLGGDVGRVIVGIAALLLCVLTVTGVILWNGWKNLILGFKIKWKAHPIRVNYDIHKVAGIVTGLFLVATAFTGFCWNFYEYAEPAIYAATFTAKSPEVNSTLISGKATLGLDGILQRSNQALPNSVSTHINFPKKPEDVFEIFKKVPQDSENFNSYVKLDQYSGDVLQVQDSRTVGLGDRILNSFTPLHYGTFGGLPTRILYVFVGISPLVLFITGVKMFKMRKWNKAKNKEEKDLVAIAQTQNQDAEINS